MEQMYHKSDLDTNFAMACYYIEKILHQNINAEYSAAKFVTQMECIMEDPEFKEAAKIKEKPEFRSFG